ncbi:18203_t:CDS:2, partial [Funneliformis geosporum]
RRHGFMWPDIGSKVMICLIFSNCLRGQILAACRDVIAFMRPDIGGEVMSQWISKLFLGNRQPLICQSLCQRKYTSYNLEPRWAKRQVVNNETLMISIQYFYDTDIISK